MSTEEGPNLLAVCKAELAASIKTSGAVGAMYAAYCRVALECARAELEQLESRLLGRERELACEAIRAQNQEPPALEAKTR